MPSLTIPDRATKKWNYTPSGDLVGVLWYSKNIDPHVSLGKLRLSERIKIFYDDSDDADFTDVPREYIRTNADATDRWWALVRSSDNAVGAMWNSSGTSPTTGWTQDASLSRPATARDSMDIFLRTSGGYDRLVVSGNSGQDLAMLNSENAVVLNIASSTNATPIQITTSANHGLGTNDQVTIANHLINTNANGTWFITRVGATTFTLNTSAGNGIGVATGTVTTGMWLNRWWTITLGQVAFSNSYPVVIKRFNKILLVANQNFVHVITPSADGSVTSLSNVSYKRLVFPDNFSVNWIVVTPSKAWFGLHNLTGGDAIATSWDGGSETYEDPIPLYDKFTFAGEILGGIPYTVNGRGQILAYNGSAFAQVAAFPCYYTNKTWNNQSTTAVPTILHRNGMRVIDGQIHMLISGIMDASSISTLEDMPAGVWVLDSELGLYCKYTIGQYRSTNNDWGARSINTPGALRNIAVNEGRFLAGASVYTNNFSTTTYGMFCSEGASTSLQRGHFVTAQLQQESASALWDDVKFKFKRLENSTDVIVVKARTEVSPTLSYVTSATTWTSTTTFTSTDVIWAGVTGGEEIEWVVGKGAGATAHVSSISVLAGTYTITIDEAIPNVSGTARVVINNYQKLGSVTDQTVNERVLQIIRSSPWVQLKFEFRGTATSPEFNEMIINYKTENI